MPEIVASPRLAPNDPRLDAWRTFLTAHARLVRRLDDELRAEHGLSLAEYETLLHLASTRHRRLRMHELAERVLLSRSGTTRLIDRLEANGLVERCACTSDGRGAEAELTATGLARLRAASATHLRGIDSYFLGVIPPDDLGVVERSLGGVASRVAACRPGTPWTEADDA
ncbi:MAG TPA: MarR family winged helix-turn-helix transcriptional regulator [Candidatus Limnocylindrales bacterium]